MDQFSFDQSHGQRTTDNSLLKLYLITDRSACGDGDLFTAVEQAIAGGVTAVQLREKDLSRQELVACARELLTITRPHNVPLIINDFVDVMLEADADGVHVGLSDMDVCEVRKLAGRRIVGATAKSREQIEQAALNGADYVGVGPVFQSSTKPDAGTVLGIDGLAALILGSPLPCVAIGGITADNAGLLSHLPLAGICTVRGILSQPEINAAARRMTRAFGCSQ